MRKELIFIKAKLDREIYIPYSSISRIEIFKPRQDIFKYKFLLSDGTSIEILSEKTFEEYLKQNVIYFILEQQQEELRK